MTRQISILGRMYVWALAGTFAALALVALYAGFSLNKFNRRQVETDLLVKARMMAPEVAPFVLAGDGSAVDAFCKKMGQLTGIRITVVLPSGVVVGDAVADTARMDNHANRPEIIQAFRGEVGSSVRFSDTIRRNFMYVAIPIAHDGQFAACMRTSMPLTTVESAVSKVRRDIMFAGGGGAIVFAMAAFALGNRIVRPIRDMQAVAERLAAGDLSARMPASMCRELASLAEALNRMASDLGERMQIITNQKNEMHAVFASMTEGVLVVDCSGNIKDINAAAEELLGMKPDAWRGRTIYENVRSIELQRLIAETLQTGGPTEAETVLRGREDRFLQMHGAALKDPSGEKIGALVVFTDMTRLKRLENMRREFVANASHELKTPVTALKGCVDTLSDPQGCRGEDSAKFLGMMARHVARLEALIEDLMSLSRLEHVSEHDRIVMEDTLLVKVLEAAVQDLLPRAKERNITLRLGCPADLAVAILPDLIEQAVSNLIDNAVKYSPSGAAVEISASREEQGVRISVADKGSGIEEKHHSRIFERFYRVDPARSRSLGGTGLGLAIVKHIVLAHGGSVSVDSAPGQGSTFTIRIPHRRG